MKEGLTHITNARIYTMEDETQTFSSMTLENGRIISLGQGPEKRAKSVDLGGRTVLPGFTDAHCHFMPSAVLNEFGANISRIGRHGLVPKSLSGVKEILCRQADLQKKKLVIGFNLVTAGLKENRLPSQRELDQWLPGKTVVIFDASGHASAYSSGAIKALDLGHLHDQGQLTGEAHEFNMGRVNSFVMKQLNPMIFLKGICGYVNRLHQCGITSVHCMEGFDDDPRDVSTKIFAFLAPVLPLHVRLYCQYTNPGRVFPFLKKMAYPRLGGGGAWEMDGAVSSGTAAFFDSYKNPEDGRGKCYYSDTKIQDMVRTADESQFQISAHAIGPRAIEPLLSAFEKSPGQKNLRHRIEHFEFPTPDQVKRAVEAGIVMVPQPGWTWVDHKYQNSYGFRLTSDQIQSQIPLRDIVSTGGIICGSSDSPVQDPDPLAQIRGMCDFPVKGQSISRYQAVKAFTVNGAFAGCEEEDRGSLCPGKRADFMVLNKDIMDDEVDLEDIRVDRVYMDGCALPENGLTPLGLLARAFWGQRKKI
ncbi:MAG: amidohydrolase family protein [Desulfobacter sp.]|nr:MAG: amidohydrolase family protein [Desulfobacter sp.]